MERSSRQGPAWLFASLLAIGAIADAALLLWYVREAWFSSLPITEFLLKTWDAVSLWTGRLLTAGGVLVSVAVFIARKRWPAQQTWQQQFAAAWLAVTDRLDRRPVAISVLTVQAGLAGILVYALLADVPRYLPPPSAILLIPERGEVLASTEESRKAGKLLRLDATTGKQALGVIDVGGSPDVMLYGRKSRNLYVLDVMHATVTVLKPDYSIKDVLASSGKVATSMAITPDERKLYISNQQPSPNATITVVDLTSKQATAHSIRGLNCPMGLAMVPNGSRLYVASQCGAGHDPVFVIDTASDRIEKVIPDFAVGGVEIAAAGKRPWIYVARGGFQRRTSGAIVDERAQVSVIDDAAVEPVPQRTIPLAATAMTTSPDGRYLFFGQTDGIGIVDAETGTQTRIDLGSRPGAISVGSQDGQNLALYAWLPEERRIFFTGLAGLLPQAPAKRP